MEPGHPEGQPLLNATRDVAHQAGYDPAKWALVTNKLEPWPDDKT
jgi:hypothetical protein